MKVSLSRAAYLSVLFLIACGPDATGPGEKPPPAESGWQPMNSGAIEHLRGVWGSSASNVFAVGDAGTILHYDGSGWTAMTSGTSVDLADVWGAAHDDVFVTGDAGTILHYDGDGWTPVTVNVTDPIGRMWGAADGAGRVQLFAIVTDGTTALLEFLDGSWYAIRRPSIPGIERFTDLTGILRQFTFPLAEALILVGENGGAFEYIVTFPEWWVMETGVQEDLVAVHGLTWIDLVATGKSSTMIRHDGHKWLPVEDVVGGDLLAIGSRFYGELFVSDASGQVFDYDYCTADRMKSNTSTALNALWGSADGVAFAAGDHGTILRYDDAPKNPVCPDNVVISVTGGTAPEITWTPACNVSKLIVEGADGASKWFVAAQGNTIEPGVTFGATPDCAIELRPAAEDLPAGEVFRVSVVRSDTEGDLLVGMWNFTPTENGWMGQRTTAHAMSAAPGTRFAQELRLIVEPVQGQPEQMIFHRVIRVPSESYAANVRSVAVIDWVRDPDPGGTDWIRYDDFRAFSTSGIDLVFDRTENDS
jgi:hypothetical protein